jgi:tetratricopeptide (TPR) repeat protein
MPIMRTITLFYLFFFSYAYLSAQPCKELNVWVDENYHSWSEPKRLEMTEAVLNVCEESIQNDTLEYAAMLNNYSSALWYNDKGKESLEVAQKAYKLIYPKREADWKLFANILNNRGTSFDKIGLLKKAQADFEEAVRIIEDMGFGDSLTTVFSLWNL